MADKTIKARIQLRNADLSAFEAGGSLASTKFSAGEMVLARLSGDLSSSYKVKIGDGSKTWAELPDGGNIIIPAANVEGLTAAIAALSTSYYSASDLSDLTGTYVNGDIAVITSDIDGTHTSYTAYRYSTQVSAWQALDGNYSAENVYMPKNMTITYDFGKYKIQSGTTSRTLACAGMNVQSFINDAFAETKQPGNPTNPSFSFGGNAGGTGEIGTKYTVNGATLTFNQGSYTYGPTPNCKAETGVKLERVAKGDVEAASATTTEDKNPGQILSINGSSVQVSYLSTAVLYTYKYTSGFYTDSTISANNNIGGLADPAKCIKANTTALTASEDATFTGQWPCYYAFTTETSGKKSVPTAITANNSNVQIDEITYTRSMNDFNKSTFTSSSKWYQLFYMIPAGKHASWSGKDGNGIPVNTQDKTQATITFMDGQTATYDVFIISNSAIASPTTCTMTYA